jgi:ankyrin repeat protein
MQLLLAAGADTEAAAAQGLTPLHSTIASGQWDAAKQLLAAGANANAGTTHGLTTLHQAAVAKQPGLVQLLLRKGANPRLQVADESGSALDASTEAGCVSVVQLLLEG